MRNDSSTLAIAMPSVERVSVFAICEIGAASEKAKMASPMPTSMVAGILIRVSTSQRTFNRSISRCSTHGMRITLSSTVRPAEKYRWVWPVVCATMKVDAASAAPCQANRWISVRMRRCESMANAISSRNAASRLTNWLASDMARSAADEEMDQHAEHPEQERGRKDLGREEQARLRQSRLGPPRTRAGEAKLRRERRDRARQRGPVAAAGDAPG